MMRQNGQCIYALLPLMAGLVLATQAGYAADNQGMKQRYAPPEIEGMRHIRVGDDDKGESKKPEKGKETDTASDREAPGPEQAPAPKTPQDSGSEGSDSDKDSTKQKQERGKPESHFRPEADWQRLGVIPGLVSGNTDRVNRALADVAAEPDKVTPYGLLLAARAHIKHDQMRRAALYYYTAKLRTRFDSLRFPANNPSAVKHDRLFSQLARQLSQPVYDWVFAEPDRFEALLRHVRKWAHATPYAYKPLYPVPKKRDRAEWPNLHEQALKQGMSSFEKRATAYRQHQQ